MRASLIAITFGCLMLLGTVNTFQCVGDFQDGDVLSGAAYGLTASVFFILAYWVLALGQDKR